MKSSSRVLLISNSTVYGRGYLDHVQEQIKTFLGDARKVLFFPLALYDRDDYAAKAKARFSAMGYALESVHATDNPQNAIEQTDAIFIGGGNTFRLLKALQDLELLEPIRRKVKRSVLHRQQCRLERRGPNDQNDQGHANCPAGLVRFVRPGPLSN
jgi:dipeptidase E